jgi:protein TonB
MAMRANRIGLGVTLALHALVLAALLSYEPARKALLAVAPIMVDLIVPPKFEEPKIEPLKPQPPTELPKPKPMVRKPVERPVSPPIIAAPAEAPSPVVVAPPAPAPAPIGPVDAGPAGGGSGGLTQPIFNADYLDNPAPAYPGASRRMREEGRVMLRVLVNVKGSADEVQLRTSSGHPRLDEAALDTVRRWKFVPAKRGAELVPAWVLIPISFRLEG